MRIYIYIYFVVVVVVGENLLDEIKVNYGTTLESLLLPSIDICK